MVKNAYSPCHQDACVQSSIGNTEWLLSHKGTSQTCFSGEKACFHRERRLGESPLGPSSRPRIRDQVRCIRWGQTSLFYAATSLLNWYKMACMGDILHILIWMTFISILSMYAQFGTYMYFRWRIIAVLRQSPAVLMFVDITGAPKL